MTTTGPQQPSNPTAWERITHYWQQARTPLLTTTVTVGVWLASGALQELGTRLIEWLW
ncbi:hypothetical protein [Nocardia shimofusensis]|uniref:hypothetical protein n=1 Tax=Nocardia shimofusensis TaxID=228596 RepID=UPI000A7D89B2|nr:hypothetical protein [Nocardia shimofusensis]